MSSGSPERSEKQLLGSRDRMILDDVIRYRLLTNDWIHKKYLAEANPNAVVKIGGRLVREGWLLSHKLFQKKRYYTAGLKLVRLRGLPQTRTRPLGPQSLALFYTALRYCSVKDPKTGSALELASLAEVSTLLPWLPSLLKQRLHVIAQSSGVLDWRILRVDLGGRADHVVRKIKADVVLIAGETAGRELLQEGRFTQVILCATPAKKKLIEQCLSERPWPKGIKFQIGVIPDLFQLLAIS